MSTDIDVVIIGAGAAGLMCAAHAAARGRQVLVLDHANKAGKKILMSGGGRCNFTNREVAPQHFISHNPHFCRSALARYTPDDFIKLVEQHGIAYHEKKLGQLFCTEKSKAILHMLLEEVANAGAKIRLQTDIKQVAKQAAGGFLLQTSGGPISCQSLVVASGGLSIPSMGASPFGYRLATQFGIKVWPTRAGLVPFTLQPVDLERLHALAGVAFDCQVATEHSAQRFTEAGLITHRGLSGPALLQISSYWRPGAELTLDLLPERRLDSYLQQARIAGAVSVLQALLHDYALQKIIVKHAQKQAAAYPALLPKRLLQNLLPAALLAKALTSLNDNELQQIERALCAWRIKPNATEGYRTAEVTLGGVDCNALSSKSFASKQYPDLYFIGEVLDVTGWLGGYNFQWAWASAVAAAQYV